MEQINDPACPPKMVESGQDMGGRAFAEQLFPQHTKGQKQKMVEEIMSDDDDHMMAKNVKAQAAAVNDLRKSLKIVGAPTVFVERIGERAATYEFMNLPTEQAVTIVWEVLPDMLERFLAKNKDYGDDQVNLGPKAEFVRIANKFGKLKRALWDGVELEFEQVDEILDDFLGHILLAKLGLRSSPNQA